ncbi:MAG: hypothetical protein PHS79_01330 [Patescibacteria group bacterium]|nr:hypothetical protein [Patescibacteria group bacterium]
MSDISLLPQDFRDKEEELKKVTTPEEHPGETLMHVPQEDAEDIEIIEVEEGEVDQVLKGEPLLSRLIYKSGVWMDEMRGKLFKTQRQEPPAKSPPQFFQPSKGKITNNTSISLGASQAPVTNNKVLITEKQETKIQTDAGSEKTGISPQAIPQSTTASLSKSKARIIPSSASPRRVRIIKRVRKSVHVSLLDQEVVRQLQVNVPKRKLTLAFMTLIFAAVFAAGYLLLGQQQAMAQAAKQNTDMQANDLRGQITTLQDQWASFSDLEVRLIALNDLMEGHVSVLNALKLLEQKTLSDVSYSGFLMDNTGHINLGVKAPSYEAAARQLQIFKESPEVKTVEANAFSKTEASSGVAALVSFQLSLQLQNEALLFEKPSVK